MVIGTKNGMLIRFNENDVRSMGRTATGVKGITLDSEDEVIGMEILEEESDILIITKNGYGKRTPANEYRIQTRGGKGLRTCNITDKNGDVVALKCVTSGEEIMVITVSGVLIRLSVSGISQMGRNTQGVKVIRLGDSEFVSTVAKVQTSEEDEELDEEVDSELDVTSEESPENE